MTEYPHARKWSWTPNSHHTQKLNHNGSITRSKSETVKVLEKNIGVDLHDLRSGNGLLDMMPKAQATKEK